MYKKLISPLFPRTCGFYPTCSTYMYLAIKEHGVIKGLWLGIRRVCRCTPRGKHGVDYVPMSIRGDNRWIF